MRAAFRAVPLFLAGVLAACSGKDEGPRWIRLAAARASSFRPAGERIFDAGGREVVVETDEHEARLALRFRPGDWKRGIKGSFSAELPFRALALRHRSSRAAQVVLPEDSGP